MSQLSPPPVILWFWIREYAEIDAAVEWTEEQALYVDGQLLGPVPKLALGKRLRAPSGEILLLHCDESWSVLGTSAWPNLEAAKGAAERAYRGIGKRWIETGRTEEEAEAWLRAEHPEWVCSFCGKLPVDLSALVIKDRARICAECVLKFHALIEGEREAN